MKRISPLIFGSVHFLKKNEQLFFASSQILLLKYSILTSLLISEKFVCNFLCCALQASHSMQFFGLAALLYPDTLYGFPEFQIVRS